MAQFAPIALFVYRRAELLDQVLDALEACPEFSASEVFVFSDGPKTAAVAEEVEAVRAFIRARLKPNMRIIEAPNNKGLARSIIESVTWLSDEYGRVIVFEDDLIVSPAILTWFNNALDRYADEPRVMQVSGHMFNVPEFGRRSDGLFLPIVTSWGWATWGRAWKLFDPEADGWERIKADEKLRRQFDVDGSYPYSRMLERQMKGSIDSWAIRWYWSVFMRSGMVLFPPQTLVVNVGNDKQATHGTSLGTLLRKVFGQRSQALGQKCPATPSYLRIDAAEMTALKRALRRLYPPIYWKARKVITMLRN